MNSETRKIQMLCCGHQISILAPKAAAFEKFLTHPLLLTHLRQFGNVEPEQEPSKKHKPSREPFEF